MKFTIIKNALGFVPILFGCDNDFSGYLINVKETSINNGHLYTRSIENLWTWDVGLYSAEIAYERWASQFYNTDWHCTFEKIRLDDLLDLVGISFLDFFEECEKVRKNGDRA